MISREELEIFREKHKRKNKIYLFGNDNVADELLDKVYEYAQFLVWEEKKEEKIALKR